MGDTRENNIARENLNKAVAHYEAGEKDEAFKKIVLVLRYILKRLFWM